MTELETKLLEATQALKLARLAKADAISKKEEASNALVTATANVEAASKVVLDAEIRLARSLELLTSPTGEISENFTTLPWRK